MVCHKKKCQTRLCSKQNILIAGLFVMGFIICFSKNINEVLASEKNNITFKGGCFTNWTVSHFLLCFFTGLICPNKLKLVVALSVLWEIIELNFEYDNQCIQTKFICDNVKNENGYACSKDKISKKDFWDIYLGKKDGDLYWCSHGIYGQMLDIGCNTIGYIIGAQIHKQIYKQK